MNPSFFYRARYGQSRALVIGIDKYAHAAPLKHAVNDAGAVSDILIAKLNFPKENVTLLCNADATGSTIRSALWRLAEQTDFDDRVVVFFAGHGDTKVGRTGDVGFLVPADGDTKDGSSLLSWREVVGVATSSMRAKHVLFVMDACYSGLATTRKPSPGATRFVGDLLKRRSIQVITAGKANQVVSDGDGPRANHSVFTGHLLNGLEGAATAEGGVLTASALMAYVYHQVGMQEGAVQTPHYGSLDGDGDLVFMAPGLDGSEKGSEPQPDLVFTLPYVDQDVVPRDALSQKVMRAKALLSSDVGSIDLHDLMMDEVRAFLTDTPNDAFPMMGQVNAQTVAERIDRYDHASLRLSVVAACVAYWGRASHRHPLLKVFARTSDRIGLDNGNTAYLSLRWLPILTTFYACGIAAVYAGQLETLAELFSMRMTVESSGRRAGNTLIGVMTEAVLGLYQSSAMQALPALKDRRTPVSDYMFETLQSRLDDALFLGKDYEAAFDQFEMLACLAGFDAELVAGGTSPYGLPGRFSGRNSYLDRSHKFADLIAQARHELADWAPLRAGLFGADTKRLKAALDEAAPPR